MASDPRAEILALIPHRDPFLFVDRIVERRQADAGGDLAVDGAPTALVTEWDVPADGDWFRGHYPGRPILPGVLVSEFSFQSAAVLLALRAASTAGAVPVLTGIENARFKSTVEPGERLTAEVELLAELSGKHYLRAAVTAAGRTVARLRFAVAEVAEAERQRARAGAAASAPVEPSSGA